MDHQNNILAHPTDSNRSSLRKFAPLDKGPIRNGILVALVALTVLIATAAFSSQLFAQSDPGTISQLTLTSDAPGDLTISWSMPSETPSDYRISWAPSSESYPSWKDANTSIKGNSYPAGSSTSLTFTGLTEGEIYKIRMRARYNAGEHASNPWSGPWISAAGTVSSTPVEDPTPAPTEEPVEDPTPAPTEEPVEETTPPSVTLSATTPVEGKSFTATLVDPDDSVSGESWSWSSSTTTTGTFTAITGATSAIYTPVAGDVGSYLRVTASYTDSSESDQTVSVDSTNATIANPSPIFADALVTFSVAEDATTDDAVGTVTATDPDNDTLTYSVGGTDTVEFNEDFNLNASSGAITVKSDATIDYDERSSYAVTITATDTFSRTDTVDVTITVDQPEVVLGNIQSLTIADSTSEPEEIDVSWVGPTDPAADQFEIAWTFEGWEYTASRDRSDTTEDHEYTITGVSELTAYAIRVRANFETEESGVYEHGPWLEQIHTTGPILTTEPTTTPEPITPATAETRASYEDHITGALTLVSNSGLPVATESTTVDSETIISQKFRTGSAQRGYTLNAVKLELTPHDGSDAAVVVSVHADAGQSYGAELFSLTSPADLDADVDVFTAPANSVLQPDTDYWLVIKNAQGSTGDADLVLSGSTTTDDSTLEGFSVSQMKVDVEDSASTSATLQDLTADVFGAFGGGTSGNGSGTRATPNTNTNTNTIRMVLTGQHVGDVPAGITTQAALTLGEERDGSTNFVNDSDWYRVELKAGVNYVFDAYLNDLYKPDNLWIYGIHDPSGTKMSVQYVHRYIPTLGADFQPWGRAYFTPASAGTYFLAAGVKHTKTADYHVKYAEADTETEVTTTPASATVGSPYHGEFFTPHGTLTAAADVDWVRVSLQASENYQFLLDVPNVWTKTDILSVRNSTGAVVSTFVPATSQRPRDDRGWWPNRSWVSANFTPATSGIYYVEITGSGAEVGQLVVVNPITIRYSIKTYYGSGYDFYVWGTDQPNVEEGVGSTDTLGHGTVFVDGFVNTDNTTVFANVNSGTDVDWHRVWFDAGEKYMIFFDALDRRRLTINGVWEPVKSYITGPFDPNIDYIPVNALPSITTDCGYTTVAAEETGFHFIEITSPRSGRYHMSVFPLDDRETTDESTLGGDVGRCASPGFLNPGNTATGTLQLNSDWDTYAVWLRAGIEYQIEARGSSSGSGTLVDPVLHIQDPLGNADESGFNQGTGNDDLWKKVVTRSGLYLIHVSGMNAIRDRTYSIGVTDLTPVTTMAGADGRAVVGQELDVYNLTDLVTTLGQDTSSHTYQWLRDGVPIPGATSVMYTLTDADTAKRISVRTEYKLADSTIGRAESIPTSPVVGNNGALIRNLGASGGAYHAGNNPLFWLGFKTGTNQDGYILDRAVVKFADHTSLEATIPQADYSAFLEGSDPDYLPKDDRKFQFLEEADVVRGMDVTLRAPDFTRLDTSTLYNISLRKTHTGRWSCSKTGSHSYDGTPQPGWELHYGTDFGSAADSTTRYESENTSRCKYGIFGRPLGSANYLTGLSINTPDDGNGFDSGDTVEVTAVFSNPITATLTMSIDIGDRNVPATTTGTNTDTFVFSYTVEAIYEDADGITFGENVLHGWVDADLGIKASRPTPRTT